MEQTPVTVSPQPPVKIDHYTEELFQKIKEQNITIDPVVWSLLTHVLGNRVYSISLILGDFLSTPPWILKFGSGVMKFLYKISGNKDELTTIERSMERALINADLIRDFLKRLRQATEKKAGF